MVAYDAETLFAQYKAKSLNVDTLTKDQLQSLEIQIRVELAAAEAAERESRVNLQQQVQNISKAFKV